MEPLAFLHRVGFDLREESGSGDGAGGVAARAARSFAIAAVAASRSSAKRGEGGGGDGVRARGGGGRTVAARGEPTASSIWRISRCSGVGGASLISALGGGVVGVRVEAIDESPASGGRWPGVVCGGFMYGGGSASSPPGLNKFGNSVMRGDAPVTERGDSDGLDGSTRALLRGDESTLRVATFFSSLSPGLKSRSSSPRGVNGDDGGVGVSLSSGIGVDGAGQDVTGCSEMTTRRSRRTRERGGLLFLRSCELRSHWWQIGHARSQQRPRQPRIRRRRGRKRQSMRARSTLTTVPAPPAARRQHARVARAQRWALARGTVGRRTCATRAAASTTPSPRSAHLPLGDAPRHDARLPRLPPRTYSQRVQEEAAPLAEGVRARGEPHRVPRRHGAGCARHAAATHVVVAGDRNRTRGLARADARRRLRRGCRRRAAAEGRRASTSSRSTRYPRSGSRSLTR